MARHPNDHDKDDDKRQAEKRAEEHSQAEEKKRAEDRRQSGREHPFEAQSVPPGDRSLTGETFVPPGRQPGTPATTETHPPDEQPAASQVRTPAGADPVLEGVKKGDLVRLLVAHYDGYQRFEAGSIVRWWNDEPPTVRNAATVETEQTPLTAPAMTDGKPPEDYIDPNTGKKPVIGSV